MSTARAAQHGPFAPLSIWLSIAVVLATASVAYAQSFDDTLAALRARGAAEGWTFTVGETGVSHMPLQQLCGLLPRAQRPYVAPNMTLTPHVGLPVAYNWRDTVGCPAVRDQSSCGACWAFATLGAVECNILIRDGDMVDLAEQWLVSCNTDGWSCNGGFWAFDYLLSKPDSCGDIGAIPESAFPYTATNATCVCSDDRQYRINSWTCPAGLTNTPPIDVLKQAILDYGPIASAVCVDQAFQNYTSGVFNASAAGDTNHAVVIVGWDDNQGASGVWIVRNSWGTSWGAAGYMLIEYGCSSIGEGAAFVQYLGADSGTIEVSPSQLDLGDVAVGDSATRTFTVRNSGSTPVNGSASGLGGAFSFATPYQYTLAPGDSIGIDVTFAPTAAGTYADTVLFTSGAPVVATVLGIGTGGAATDACIDAPLVSDGTFTASNAAASTDGTSSCNGTADVWWRYRAPITGVAEIDTCQSDFDTVLSAYGVCGGAQLTCNDDFAGCLGHSSGSRIALNVVANAQYRIRVAGRAGAVGNIVLRIVTSGPEHTISGRVTTADGFPVAGVILTGLPGSPVTDASGVYAASVAAGFTASAQPTKTALTFDPTHRDYVDLAADATNQNYSVTAGTYVISGHIADSGGTPLSGVQMIGLPGSPVTSVSGDYTATVASGFTGTVTPTRTATDFAPVNRAYSNVVADASAQNYVGTPHAGGISVALGPAAAVVAGALWRLDDGDWRTNGDSVTGVLIGAHTVSYATVLGWTAPVEESVTISEDQIAHLNRVYIQQYYALTLTAQPADYGTVTATTAPSASGLYLQDTVVGLAAVPQPGYRVRQWQWADTLPAAGSQTNTVTMTGHQTVIVEFEPLPLHPYQLTASVSAGQGTLTPLRGVYHANERVTLTATPAAGYQVKSWTGTDDDTSADNVNTVTMSGAKTVGVAFELWTDCNHNGVSDRIDTATGASADCDANGVPDECQADSDGDGLIDACESSSGGNNSNNNNGGSNSNTNEQSNTDNESDTLSGTGFNICGLGVAETLAMTLVGLGLLKRSPTTLRRR